MQSFVLLAFSLLIARQYAYAETPPNATAGGCALLNSTIYCYGGYSGNSNTSSRVYELDISKQFQIQSTDIYTMWNSVTVNSASQPRVSAHFAIASIPTYHRFVIDGGASASGAIPGKNQSSLAFQTDKQTWDIIPNMTAITVQSHTMVLGNSSANLLYLWGGYGVRSRTDMYWSGTRVLDLNTNSWKYLSSLPSSYGIRFFHSAVLAKDNNTIYYIGGKLATLLNNATAASTTDISSNYTIGDPGMSSIYAYNTVMDSWANLTIGGSTTPSSRVLHSTVLLSDGNILLYGGSQLNNMTAPVSDYFYVLNTTNGNALTWETFKINETLAPGPGPRYGQSAIRVSNTTVFILFGSTASETATNKIHILDVSTWAWSRSFAGISSTASSPGLPQPSSTPPNGIPGSGVLSGGAIAGVVIGVLAAIVLISTLVFFIKRQRRDTSTFGEYAKEREAIAVPYVYASSYRPGTTTTTATTFQGSPDENSFFSRQSLPQESNPPPASSPSQQSTGHTTTLLHHAAVLPPTTAQDAYQSEPYYNPHFHEMIYTPQLALRPIPPPPQSETPRSHNDED